MCYPSAIPQFCTDQICGGVAEFSYTKVGTTSCPLEGTYQLDGSQPLNGSTTTGWLTGYDPNYRPVPAECAACEVYMLPGGNPCTGGGIDAAACNAAILSTWSIPSTITIS